MPRSLYLLLLLAGSLGIYQPSFADDWQLAGPAQEAASPYNFYYYKLIQINQASHRYASIIDVSMQGDANYYYAQGTYRIRVDKYEATTGRFDGLEILCTSGNSTAVNGDIFSKKVKVTLTGWPDYVFRKDYNLLSLQSLEAYIQEHQHLPGIPEAATAEKDDLDVGEMNKKLLEKTEETTLYLIALNKKVDKLEKENAAPKEKLQLK